MQDQTLPAGAKTPPVDGFGSINSREKQSVSARTIEQFSNLHIIEFVIPLNKMSWRDTYGDRN
jgi:hypothetical protein